MSDNYPGYLTAYDTATKEKQDYIQKINNEFKEAQELFYSKKEAVEEAKRDYKNNYKKYDDYKTACSELEAAETDLKEKADILNNFGDNSETYDIDYDSETATTELKAVYDAYETELQTINTTIQDSTKAIVEAKKRYIAIKQSYNVMIQKTNKIRNGAPTIDNNDSAKPSGTLPTTINIENTIHDSVVNIKQGFHFYIN